MLKVYEDPRITDEPVALESFQNHNRSTILKAPKLYKYEMVSPYKGWLIMERLPEKGSFFVSPISHADKEEVARLYLEYRTNFPAEPTRELTLAEQLPAADYHEYRIHRWFELATSKEAERVQRGDKPVLSPDDFLSRYEKAIGVIRSHFAGQPMSWGHGHFKPHELYSVAGSDSYYLTDFAHAKMHPEGYELAFIIWSDHLAHGDWTVEYAEWRDGVDDWLEVLRPVGEQLGIKDFDTVMRAGLLERSLGTILADITAAERPREEQLKRVALLYQFIDELATS